MCVDVVDIIIIFTVTMAAVRLLLRLMVQMVEMRN